MVTSLYRIRRTSATGLLEFNLDYPDSFNLIGQNVVFQNSFLPVDLYIRPGLSISLKGSPDVADKIYLQGNWADYTSTVQVTGGTLSLSRGTGNTQETVTFVGAAASQDVLVFKNGSLTVAQIEAVDNPPGEPLTQAAIASALNALSPSGTQTSATVTTPAPAAGQMLEIKVLLVDPAGENTMSFGPGSKTTISGSAGVDRVYVTAGSWVYAVNLRGGIDEIYMRGPASDYTSDLSNPGVLTLTRSVTVNGKATMESVSVGSSLINNDLLVFADGAIRSNTAALAFKADAQASLSSLNSWNGSKTTPSMTPQLDLDNIHSGKNYRHALSKAETKAGASIALAPDTLVSFSAIQSIQVAMAGAGLDVAHDLLLLTGPASGATAITLHLDTSAQASADISIGNIAPLRYSYSASTHVLSIRPGPDSTIAAADVGNIVSALKFQNTEARPNPGLRSFAVSLTNAYGEGEASTASLDVPVVLDVLTCSLKAAANARKALDVTSDLVFGVSAGFSGQLVAGSGVITVVDNGPADGASVGYRGENSIHSFTIPVLVNGALNPLIHITGTGANTKIIITPDANFDFDLAASYTITIPAGALQLAGQNTVTAEISASFNTVVPHTLSGVTLPAGLNQASETHTDATVAGIQSYRMNANTGALDVGNKWLSVEGLGDSAKLKTVDLDVGGGDYTLVVRDSLAAGTVLPLVDNLKGMATTHDVALLLKNFGLADRLYVDDQNNDDSKINIPAALGNVGNGSEVAPYQFVFNTNSAGARAYIGIVFASGLVDTSIRYASVAAVDAALFKNPVTGIDAPYYSVVLGG